MMTIEYDQGADAAYIYFIEKEHRQAGWVKNSYPCDPAAVNGMINLDFDVNGYLGGIEIMDASKKLPKEILDQAGVID